jgi:tetratricopeptide (TPR) repeat protein
LLFLCWFLPALQLQAHEDLLRQIENVTVLISSQPANATLLLHRGDLYRQHQQWAEAESDLKTAENLNPQLHALYLCRGKLFLSTRNFTAAKSSLDHYLQFRTNAVEGLVTRARVLVQSGNLTDAIKDFSDAISLAPEPEYYLERAHLLADMKQVDQALAGLEEALKRLGPLLLLEQAAIDLETSNARYDAALARLDGVIARVSRKETWWVRQGEILTKAGRHPEACQSFTAALRAMDALPPRFQETLAIRELRQRATAALANPHPQNAP